MQKTKVAIYIGKFQIPHFAHEANIHHGLQKYNKVIVLVGSANKRSSIQRPFPYQTIKKWITNISEEIIVRPLNDYIYNEMKWISEVENIVYSEFPNDDVEFTLIGHTKDDSSYYLKEFPNFRYEELPSSFGNISSTEIREDLFDQGLNDSYFPHHADLISTNIVNDIEEFRKTEEFKDLLEEYDFYKKEQEMFKEYPFPETLKFNCSDAVVVCDGNILLVRRSIAPGKNTWALPGGFVNRNETYQETSIRELYEETKIKVPEKVMIGSQKRTQIFDSPKRNLGIPRITKAFYFEIQPDFKSGFAKLPKVKGADDAAEAKWIPLAKARRMHLFDDHSDIIDFFTNSF